MNPVYISHVECIIIIIIIIIFIMLLRWSGVYTSDQLQNNINKGTVYAATDTYYLHEEIVEFKTFILFQNDKIF